MPENEDEDARFNTYVISSLAVTSALLLLLPMAFVIGKETAYSAYEEDDFYQLSDMRDTFSNEERYFVANTMSTPMLVNDWKDPHRTLLAIIGPEKPIDDTEANEIYKFVTERGGKVIVAADNTNANRLASMFGITFFNSPMLDEKQHWVVHDQQGQASAISWKNVWSASSIKQDVDQMSPGALMQGCTTFQIENYDPTDCRLPIMFRSPTGLKFEPLLRDAEDPDHRKVMTLAKASPSAFIDIEGKAAHAGNHYSDGADANLEAAHKTLALTDLTDLKKGTTVNVGKISGGIGANTISPKAHLTFELRYTTSEERDRVLQSVNEIVTNAYVSGTHSTLSGGIQRDVMQPSEDQERFVADINRLCDVSLPTEHRGGVSDANIVSSQGVPTLDGWGPFGDGDHTIYERASKASFEKRIDLVTKIFAHFMNGEFA